MSGSLLFNSIMILSKENRYAFISYLRWNLKKGAMVDLPCYTNPAVQDDFRKKIRESYKKMESSAEDMEIVKILAPWTDNPNTPNNLGITPISWAADRGHTEIVQILAPLTDNPNDAPNEYKWTPIHRAAQNGNTEIVKILASLTDNPN